MRSTLTISLVLLLLVLAGSCGQDQKQNASAGAPEGQVAAKASEPLTPEQLGELGAQIRKSPDRTAELLREHGLTEKSFEAEIRKVTEDPEASKKYAEAYKKASA